MRHGHAESATGGQSDQTRKLTPEGLARIKQQAQGLARGDFPVQIVLTSPFDRARQTAEVFAAALGAPLETDDLLAAGASLDDVAELLDRYPNEEVMLVGHQPDLGQLVDALTGCSLPIQPGTLVVVEADRLQRAAGQLLALLPPDQLIRFGEVL